MKTRYLIALYMLLLFGGMFPLSAQSITAQEAMERAVKAFRDAKGIEAEFTVQSYSKKKELQTASSGRIRLHDEKFRIDTDETITWFDGHTQWSYLVGSNEVNISEPTPEELQMMNPYSFFSLYKNGYRLKQGKNGRYGGKAVYELLLTSADKRKALQNIVLYITKDTFQPLCVTMVHSGGENLNIHITAYHTKKVYSDKLFVFDKKLYPGVEVIDLR